MTDESYHGAIPSRGGAYRVTACCGVPIFRVCDQCGYCDGCGPVHLWSEDVRAGGAPHYAYGCGTSLEQVSASLAGLGYDGSEVAVRESDQHRIVGYASATSWRAVETGDGQ